MSMRAAASKFIRRAGSNATLSRRFSSYPEHQVVMMPSLSPTMAEGTLISWGKKVGDQCSPGDTIADIQTDKAMMFFEGQDDFFIAKLLVEAGADVAVGSPIMITVEEESSVAAFANYVLEATATPVAAVAPPVVVESKPVVIAPPAIIPVAPKISAPAPVPVVSPVQVAAPAPVVIAPAPVIAPTGALNLNGVYSVKWSSGAVAKSAIAARLSKDQQAYLLKYGRSGQMAI